MDWACLHWSESAWEAAQASESLMVIEQRVSASGMEWVQVALASLMDSAVLELFWQSSMSSSQANFCQWVLMDGLVASSSPRALLAFSWRWLVSVGGVAPLGPGVSTVGEVTVGISSREASAISVSSGVLTWDDVSTGLERSLSLWGEGVSMTMGFGLFGVKFPDT